MNSIGEIRERNCDNGLRIKVPKQRSEENKWKRNTNNAAGLYNLFVSQKLNNTKITELNNYILCT